MGRPAPKFWWDFVLDGDDCTILVQSDREGWGELDKFPVPKGQTAEAAIELAENVISDYEAGRKTPLKGNKETRNVNSI